MPTLPAAGDTSWRDDWAQAVHDAATAVADGRLSVAELAETVRDTIGTALVAGANVTITADDTANTITIAAAGTDAEVVRDTIGTALTAGTGITKTVNDAGDTITIAASAASTTVEGIVELATDTETQTGTDTTRAITPANLTARTATETRTGVVELATAAETTTGSSNSLAVHPAGLKVELDKKANALVTTTTQSGTTYTLVLADGGTDIEFTNGLAIAVSIPTNASVAFPTGTIITLWPRGGQITVAAVTPGTTTVESRSSAFKSAGVNGPVTLKKRATDGWLVTGDITT